MTLHCNLTNANVEHKANHNTKEASRTKSIIHEPHSANNMECTHFATKKRYRILRSDLDPNSSRHGHLNEHQEDILPWKTPKACVLERKKIKNIESSETWNQQHWIQRKFCWSVVKTSFCHEPDHNTKEAFRPDKIIHEPHSANNMEYTHFATKKGTGYWDLTWTPTHLGTDTWMNTRKTFCPGRGQKPAFWKRKILNPARPKISNIESSENFAHRESTP